MLVSSMWTALPCVVGVWVIRRCLPDSMATTRKPLLDSSHTRTVFTLTKPFLHCLSPWPQMEAAALQRIMEALEQNTPARRVPLSEDEAPLVKGLQLLTMKPMIYAANVPEGDLADEGAGNPHVAALRRKAEQEGCEVIIVSAQVWAHCGGQPVAGCCYALLKHIFTIVT